MSNNDGFYSVVWPRSEKTVELTQLAPRLETLEGKTVCELWDYLFRGDEIFPWLETELEKRFPGIKFIRYSEFGSTHGDEEHEILENLPAKLKELGADAVISGMGC
tara:strand:+ start:71 stop:388 length:318 start_codon:yes stop_codon:yes gene_type:complete